MRVLAACGLTFTVFRVFVLFCFLFEMDTSTSATNVIFIAVISSTFFKRMPEPAEAGATLIVLRPIRGSRIAGHLNYFCPDVTVQILPECDTGLNISLYG